MYLDTFMSISNVINHTCAKLRGNALINPLKLALKNFKYLKISENVGSEKHFCIVCLPVPFGMTFLLNAITFIYFKCDLKGHFT